MYQSRAGTIGLVFTGDGASIFADNPSGIFVKVISRCFRRAAWRASIVANVLIPSLPLVLVLLKLDEGGKFDGGARSPAKKLAAGMCVLTVFELFVKKTTDKTSIFKNEKQSRQKR